jgi:hypothetical protein
MGTGDLARSLETYVDMSGQLEREVLIGAVVGGVKMDIIEDAGRDVSKDEPP